MVLAQQTVNDAIPLLRSIDEESFRASTAILDAMKNNISMWIEDKNRDKENCTAEKEKSSKSTADEKESGNSVPYTTPYSTRPPSPVIRRAGPSYACKQCLPLMTQLSRRLVNGDTRRTRVCLLRTSSRKKAAQARRGSMG
ncbi:hypothetical protein ACP70R_034766 [Stipagrostis hirtigluma subsp. patula]